MRRGVRGALEAADDLQHGPAPITALAAVRTSTKVAQAQVFGLFAALEASSASDIHDLPAPRSKILGVVGCSCTSTRVALHVERVLVGLVTDCCALSLMIHRAATVYRPTLTGHFAYEVLSCCLGPKGWTRLLGHDAVVQKDYWMSLSLCQCHPLACLSHNTWRAWEECGITKAETVLQLQPGRPRTVITS